MRKACLIFLLFVLPLVGCAGKMDAQRGLSEEWRLRSLEENFLNFKEYQRDQEERSKEQQRKLMDRMRAIEESLSRLQDQSAAGSLRASTPMASAPAARAPRSVAPDAVAEHDELGMRQAPVSTHAAVPANPVKGLYEQGLSLVRAERSEEGRKVMQEFLETDPQSALVPNALYWIGESYYQEKNYPQAILTFKDVSRRFAKHHKAAASLYKIGMCYVMLGETDNATLYLRALLKEYPKSEPAPAARKKLAELGG